MTRAYGDRAVGPNPPKINVPPRRPRFFLTIAFLLLPNFSAVSAQEAASGPMAAQEIPKEANVIIARTKLAPTDAYRAAMQRLVGRGYFLAFSDPVAMLASTLPYSYGLNWDLKVRITFFVGTDATGTYVRISGWSDFLASGPIDYRGGSSSPAMKAWGELDALARALGDAGLEYRMEALR